MDIQTEKISIIKSTLSANFLSQNKCAQNSFLLYTKGQAHSELFHFSLYWALLTVSYMSRTLGASASSGPHQILHVVSTECGKLISLPNN